MHSVRVMGTEEEEDEGRHSLFSIPSFPFVTVPHKNTLDTAAVGAKRTIFALFLLSQAFLSQTYFLCRQNRCLG